MSSINVALQGLSVAQRSFEVAGHNIANVNTPGFSRQEVTQSARGAPEIGVRIDRIARVVDQFATAQLWRSTSAFKESESMFFFSSRVDDLLANPQTSLSGAMDNFFAGLQAGVDDPASIPSRELIVAQSEALTIRFAEVDLQLRTQSRALNSRITSSMEQVSEIAVQVGSLNDSIRLAYARGDQANELKDQRDEMVRQIGEFMNVSIQTGADGSDINLFIGNGQPLVVGGNVSSIKAVQGDPDFNDVRVMIDINGKTFDVSDNIAGGEVGGMIAFKDQVLLPTWNEVGRLAVVFADTMNQQHRKGVDIDGNKGGDWFVDPQNFGDVKAFGSNNTRMDPLSNVVLADTGKLQASDYKVKFFSGGDFLVTRLSDNQQFRRADFTDAGATYTGGDMTFTQDVNAGKLEFSLDGMNVELLSSSGVSFTENDQMLIQPVRTGAELMKVELRSGRELAFASPVRGETAIDNLGTVSIEKTVVNDRMTLELVPGSAAPAVMVHFTGPNTYDVYDAVNFPDISIAAPISTGNLYNEGEDIAINGGTLSVATITQSLFSQSGAVPDLRAKPLQIRFDSATTYSVFDVSNPAAPQLLLANAPYTEGQPIQLPGFEVTPKGKPQPGDKIDFSFNDKAVSDNRNALMISDLQLAQTIEGATYQDNYGRLVERVGTSTNLAMINEKANESILRNAESVRNGISGVNLDEEAANIIKFQQAYQAAAQLINTARTMFDTMLQATG